MDKTIAYWVEKLLGFFIGLIVFTLSLKYWNVVSCIIEATFLDKLITISTTLFGFLLTILTLIIQSNSEIVKSMKNHGGYNRLINFNKSIIILSSIVCILSLIIYIINLSNIKEGYEFAIIILGSILSSIFAWSLIDSFIFVLIFYKILLEDN